MLVTKGLTRKFGNVVAVDGLDLQAEQGRIFGLIGPNGAGKTTTMRMLCGLLKPTSGTILVDGEDMTGRHTALKMITGYLPESAGTYPGMMVWEYLDFFAAAYRLPRSLRRERVEAVLHTTGAEAMRNYTMESLSTGMRRRVGIARTLIHEPKILILDEPTSGLDPRARIRIRELLRRLRDEGRTIIVSSHILLELATVCDAVGIMEEGKMVLQGNMKEVLQEVRQERVMEAETVTAPTALLAFLESRREEGIEVIETAENMVRFRYDADDERIARLLAEMVQKDLGVIWFREATADLEEVFMKVTGDRPAGARRTE